MGLTRLIRPGKRRSPRESPAQRHLDRTRKDPAAGAHAAMVSPFILLDFADPDDPDIAYVESHVGARYLERPEELAEYRRVFRLIRQQSIPIGRVGNWRSDDH